MLEVSRYGRPVVPGGQSSRIHGVDGIVDGSQSYYSSTYSIRRDDSRDSTNSAQYHHIQLGGTIFVILQTVRNTIMDLHSIRKKKKNKYNDDHLMEDTNTFLEQTGLIRITSQ